MAKYDSQITELKTLLPNAQNILICLPVNCDIDRFAGGLALFLSLKQAGKTVSIVSDDIIKVAQSHLFGVDNISQNLPQSSDGSFILSLEGVVAPDGSVPALQKLDWFPEGNNLNLVFHTLPGQTFQPAKITPRTSSGGFNLIFTIGASGLNNLGNIYLQNSKVFEGVHIVNIDIQNANTGFGKTNILDPGSSSISEILTDLIPTLSLPQDQDIASNLLAGIFDTTSNLTKENLGADTFMAVANLLRSGGKKPHFTDASRGEPFIATAQQVQTQPQPPKQGFDLSVLMPAPDSFTVPPIAPNTQTSTPSPEERPSMEGVSSAETIEPEPGWLTPKVFKGSAS